MIRLSVDQMAVVAELEALAGKNSGVLNSFDVESYDEDLIEFFFRNKILVLIKGSTGYRLDKSHIISHDPVELEEQSQNLRLQILLKLMEIDRSLARKRA